ARARAVWPGLAEARHRTIDDGGIDGADRFIIEPVAPEIADLEILHHDVGRFYQRADDLLAFRLRNVDGDRFLAAVGAEIERIVVVLFALGIGQIGRPEGAGIVAAARALDLDYLGPQIGQHLRRERPGQHPGQINDFDARKRQIRHEHFSEIGEAPRDLADRRRASLAPTPFLTR